MPMRSFVPILARALLVVLLLLITSSNATAEDTQACDSTMMLKVVVVGATGATGKHVVQQLLDQGHSVDAIARSKERLLGLLNTTDQTAKNLRVTEAAILDMSDKDLVDKFRDVDAVVTCLGHNLNFRGIWGEPRRLVTDAVTKLTNALASSSTTGPPKKFILMGSDGVANPAGTDDERSWGERSLLTVLRWLVPPHVDNEEAAATVHGLGKSKGVEWVVIRPTDLIDADVSDYQLMDKPKGSLFGSGVASRSNVAKSMVDLLTDDKLWQQYKFHMPVLHDAPVAAKE